MPAYVDLELFLPDCRVTVKRNKTIKGQELLLQICDMLFLKESNWFGLMCKDYGLDFWIDPDCEIGSHLPKLNSFTIEILFSIKAYPLSFSGCNLEMRALEFFYRNLFEMILTRHLDYSYDNLVEIVALGKFYFDRADQQLVQTINMQYTLNNIDKFLVRCGYDVSKFHQDVESRIFLTDDCREVLETALEIMRRNKNYGEYLFDNLWLESNPETRIYLELTGLRLASFEKGMNLHWSTIKSASLQNKCIVLVDFSGEKMVLCSQSYSMIQSAFYMIKAYFLNFQYNKKNDDIKSVDVNDIFVKHRFPKKKGKSESYGDSANRSRTPSMSNAGHKRSISQGTFSLIGMTTSSQDIKLDDDSN